MPKSGPGKAAIVAPLAGRRGGSRSDDLNHQFPPAGPGVALYQHDLLPGAELQVAVGEGDRQGGAEQGGPYVTRPVVVAPAQMVPVIGPTRREPAHHAVDVRNRARY